MLVAQIRLLLLGLVVLLASCGKECVEAEGTSAQDERIIFADLTKLHLQVAADLHLTINDSLDHTRVLITAQPKVIEELETSIDNQTLIFSFGNCVDQHNEITINVEMPSVRGLRVNGVGKIISDEIIRANQLNVHISGTGDADLLVDVNELNTLIEGSGVADLAGVCENHTGEIFGGGDIEAFQLASTNSHMTIHSSGRVNVFVTNLLTAILEGNGDLYYRGEPDIISTINGTGTIIDDNQ